MSHQWEYIKEMPTSWGVAGSGDIHESVFRSYQILEVVTKMVERGDSTQTIKEFIRWAKS